MGKTQTIKILQLNKLYEWDKTWTAKIEYTAVLSLLFTKLYAHQ